MEYLEEIKTDKYIIKLSYDEVSELSNPRKTDYNLGTIVYNHSRYYLGEETIDIKYNHSSSNWEEAFIQWLRDEKCLKLNQVVYLPVFLYDHSGIAINTTGFSCSWDSCQIGYIYVEKKKLYQEYGVKRISKQLKNTVIDILRSEIDIYSQYLKGEVYCFEVFNKETKKLEGTYNGFIGYEKCKQEALTLFS